MKGSIYFEVFMKIVANPEFSVPVSGQERKLAKNLRDRFEELIVTLDEFDKFLLVFFDNVDDLEDNVNLTTLGPLIKKYEHKLKKKFNFFMTKLEDALDNYQTGFSDTKLDNIRDLIIENTKGMRNGLIKLIRLFKKVKDPEFVKEAKDTYVIIAESIAQLNVIIKEELFRHIDYDILGRIRLGVSEAPLVLKKR